MNAIAPTPEWLTAAQAADRLGLNRNTVYKMARAGRLRVTHIGSLLRVSPAEIERVLKEGIPRPGALEDDPLA